MERILVTAVLVVTEVVHGFSLIFLTLFTAVNIFGRSFKRGILIPVIAGIILGFFAMVSYIETGSVNISVCLLLTMIPTMTAAWLVYTDRTLTSLVSLVLALIFTDSIISTTGTIVYTVTTYLVPTSLKVIFQLVDLIFVYTLSILYMKLLHILAGRSTKEPLSLPNTALITIPVLLLTVSSGQNYYSMADIDESADISEVIVSSVILLCISLFVVFMIKNNQNKYLERINHLNEEYLNMQSRHFEMAKKNDTAIRKINHDMRNHLFCLNELYREGKYEELGKYLADMTETYTNAQPAVKTGSSIADAIISEKAAAAERYNVSVKVSGTFGDLKLSAYELCTILANLLDNAVEAASYFCVKHRWVDVSCRTSGNFTVLTIRNVTAYAVDVKSPVRTIKADKLSHGFGLGNVRAAVERAGGDLMLSCDPYEGEFIFTAEVFLPEENMK